jgi:dTDP-4-amino-4,6-dideoxygalactose transaminase
VPWCVPDLTGCEARYLAQAIAAGQAGPAGEFLARFEARTAELTGVRHAVATCSGTAALHIAYLLAGVQPGDEVILPAWTFVATANAVRHAGGYPVALDIDPRYWQLDPDLLERFLTRQCRLTGGRLTDTDTGRPVAAVAPVDLLGHPADLDAITALARRHGITVVEDAAQGIGATCRGHPAGGSGLAAVSFNLNKIITAGSGGAILTSDDNVATRARYLISQARDHPAEYRHGEPGWKYRMTNLHAAIGCAQLERASQLITAKQRIHARYVQALSEIPGVRFQQQAPWATATRWLTTITINPQITGTTASRLRTALAGDDIQTGPPWTPLHLTGAHHGCAPEPCPVAEQLGRDAFHLPSSASLTSQQQDQVITAILTAVR